MSVQIHDMPESTVSQELQDRWKAIPVAVAVDLDSGIRQIDPALRSLLPAAKHPVFLGRALTAQCQPPDFGAVMYSLDRIQTGDVLVIAANGHAEHAMIGDILCGHLRALGISGIVCDGAVRDVSIITSWTDFPVYCRSINPRGPTGKEHGSINGIVKIGTSHIAAGDWILGDADGLVALSAEELASWIDDAEARIATEERWMRQLADGEPAATVFGL